MFNFSDYSYFFTRKSTPIFHSYKSFCRKNAIFRLILCLLHDFSTEARVFVAMSVLLARYLKVSLLL